jgi:hypothetical protein
MHRRSFADGKIASMRRFVLAAALVVAVVVTRVAPAVAHTGFEPDEAAPGTIVTVTLNAADERDAAAITKVELFLPENVDVPVADPAGPPGWGANVLDGSVVWEGPASDGDQSFTVTFGPLPTELQRLQFKVLQTYDNGEIDRWIEDHLPGAEPEMPGPVIDLVEGGPGTIPEATTTVSAPDPTVVIQQQTTTTEAAGNETDDAGAPGEADDDDDSSVLPIVVIVVGAVLVVAGAGLYLGARRR